mmetsp:Transcript_65225/g.173353  ORF Transcript_65225/g.173353 Transcript_65225/m.173353 type:complete len:340 (+) Transcript_65225:286-1305(+)
MRARARPAGRRQRDARHAAGGGDLGPGPADRRAGLWDVGVRGRERLPLHLRAHPLRRGIRGQCRGARVADDGSAPGQRAVLRPQRHRLRLFDGQTLADPPLPDAHAAHRHRGARRQLAGPLPVHVQEEGRRLLGAVVRLPRVSDLWAHRRPPRRRPRARERALRGRERIRQAGGHLRESARGLHLAAMGLGPGAWDCRRALRRIGHLPGRVAGQDRAQRPTLRQGGRPRGPPGARRAGRGGHGAAHYGAAQGGGGGAPDLAPRRSQHGGLPAVERGALRGPEAQEDGHRPGPGRVGGRHRSPQHRKTVSRELLAAHRARQGRTFLWCPSTAAPQHPSRC